MPIKFSSSRHLGSVGPGHVSPFLARSSVLTEPVAFGSTLSHGRPQPRYVAGADVQVSRTDVQRYINLAHTREMEARGQNVWQPSDVRTKNNGIVRFSLVATFNRSFEQQSGIATRENRVLPSPVKRKVRTQRRLPVEPEPVQEEEEEEGEILFVASPREGARAPEPEEKHPIIISKARVGVAAEASCVRPVSIHATTFGPSGPVATIGASSPFKRLRTSEKKDEDTLDTDRLMTPKRDWKSKSLPSGKKDSPKRASITMDADEGDDLEDESREILNELREMTHNSLETGTSVVLHRYLNTWQRPPLFVPVDIDNN